MNFKSGDTLIQKVVKPVLIPSEMVMIKINKDKIANLPVEEIEVSLEER